ncbi:15292_t:CDS:2 [Funneliformis mosseae]|uniref:15292_t:CDS:1 n=1 Tax=Funneliformis mosseae TaxID=27381 RepID=A0A9N9HUE3_FUNMO|nr:15292_t:CDS:2 [Funneliformis mosseae]
MLKTSWGAYFLPKSPSDPCSIYGIMLVFCLAGSACQTAPIKRLSKSVLVTEYSDSARTPLSFKLASTRKCHLPKMSQQDEYVVAEDAQNPAYVTAYPWANEDLA